jgi:glycosyltransferase involved in cell wall biosynthesis
MNIKYISPLYDHSGYGEAGRMDILALESAHIGITAACPTFTRDNCEFGDIARRIRKYENNDLPYNVIITQITPNHYKKYHEEGKYHVMRVLWETDKLPVEFTQNLTEYADEIWTTCKYTQDAIKRSGINKPVYLVPYAIDPSVNPDNYQPFQTAADGLFKFYSVFEWTARKNPAALLEAYLSEFNADEPVCLLLKTYVDNFTREKRDEIDRDIRAMKHLLKKEKYPPIYLCRNLLSREQMFRFHKTGDCFVSAHHGEGWGMPQSEAMVMGKPIISTGCGGIHEYLEHEAGAFLIPYSMGPLTGNTRNQQWYTRDQNWANVDISKLREAMRGVFEQRENVDNLGISCQRTVNQLFSPITVGQQIYGLLDGIETLRAKK